MDYYKTRNELINKLRTHGRTLEDIGDLFGITRERVRQLTAEAVFTPDPPDTNGRRLSELDNTELAELLEVDETVVADLFKAQQILAVYTKRD